MEGGWGGGRAVDLVCVQYFVSRDVAVLLFCCCYCWLIVFWCFRAGHLVVKYSNTERQ